MGFKLSSFGAQIARRASEERRTREEEANELLKIGFVDRMETVREERKARRAKKEKLTAIGKSLEQLGISGDGVAGILATDIDEASATLKLLQESARTLPDFKIDDVVQASGTSGITVQEAVDRVMGELQTTKEADSIIQTDDSFFAPSQEKLRERAQEMAGAFGEDYDQIFKESAGEYVRGELPKTDIDYQALYRADPLADLRRRQLEAQVVSDEFVVENLEKNQKLKEEIAELDQQIKQKSLTLTDAKIKKIQNDLHEIDLKSLSIPENRGFRKDIGQEIANTIGLEVSWNPDTGYTSLEKDQNKQIQFFNLQQKALEQMSYYYRLGQVQDQIDPYVFAMKKTREILNLTGKAPEDPK